MLCYACKHVCLDICMGFEDPLCTWALSVIAEGRKAPGLCEKVLASIHKLPGGPYGGVGAQLHLCDNCFMYTGNPTSQNRLTSKMSEPSPVLHNRSTHHHKLGETGKRPTSLARCRRICIKWFPSLWNCLALFFGRQMRLSVRREPNGEVCLIDVSGFGRLRGSFTVAFSGACLDACVFVSPCPRESAGVCVSESGKCPSL